MKRSNAIVVRNPYAGWREDYYLRHANRQDPPYTRAARIFDAVLVLAALLLAAAA
jgi:hypothetical protein